MSSDMLRGKHTSRLFVVLGLLALASLACSAISGLTGSSDGPLPVEESAPIEGEAPAQEGESAPPAGSEGETVSGDSQAGGDAPQIFSFNSPDFATQQEVIVDWQLNSPDGSGTGQMKIQYEPFMAEMTFTSFEGADAGDMPFDMSSGMTFFMTEDAFYMVSEEMGCMGFSGGEMMPTGPVNPGDFVNPDEESESPQLQYVGPEQIDGVPTQHYRGQQADYEGVQNTTIDVWYAPSMGMMRRMIVTGEPTGGSGGVVTMQYDYSLPDGPLNLAQPENCQDFAIPEGLPSQ